MGEHKGRLVAILTALTRTFLSPTTKGSSERGGCGVFWCLFLLSIHAA